MWLNKRPRIWEDCLGRQQAGLEAQAQVLVEQAAILLLRRHDIGPTSWDSAGRRVCVCVWSVSVCVAEPAVWPDLAPWEAQTSALSPL